MLTKEHAARQQGRSKAECALDGSLRLTDLGLPIFSDCQVRRKTSQKNHQFRIGTWNSAVKVALGVKLLAEISEPYTDRLT